MWCTSGCGSAATSVFAVNPNADQVEGDTCYHDLKSIPGGVDWVLIGTRPRDGRAPPCAECADLGIKRVWMHRGPGAGSVSHAAAEYGRQHGITVIEGGCPCMFGPTADPGHKAMRLVFSMTGQRAAAGVTEGSGQTGLAEEDGRGPGALILAGPDDRHGGVPASRERAAAQCGRHFCISCPTPGWPGGSGSTGPA